jgi:amidase
MNKLLESSAVQLGELIERKEISSVELTEMHLERIREVNPKLNAVFHLAEDSARQMALAADKDLARGSRASPLHGVPFTVKDWIEVAGMPCVANDERYRDHIPTQHATVVELMLRAGCVLLGKTSVSDDSPIYGRTYNPYQLDLSPAGSSSGEAAIIAAGGSAFGLGSDSGGSIRDPAHACGIAGLRPTTGRVSVAGHLPRINTLVDPRTVIGPMARFVEDLPMALRFISCSDWRVPSVVWTGSGHWKHVDPLRLCGAFYSHYQGGSPTPDCGRVAEETAELLRGLGVSICEALPGRIDEALPITRAYWSRAGSEGLEDEWAPDGEGQMTGLGVERHPFLWDRFRRSLLAFMEPYDFILTPVSDFPAQPHGGNPDGASYCLPYSLAGYPCVVVRAGTSVDGLPVGIQVVGRPWRDHVALAVAWLIEKELGGWQPPDL